MALKGLCDSGPAHLSQAHHLLTPTCSLPCNHPTFLIGPQKPCSPSLAHMPRPVPWAFLLPLIWPTPTVLAGAAAGTSLVHPCTCAAPMTLKLLRSGLRPWPLHPGPQQIPVTSISVMTWGWTSQRQDQAQEAPARSLSVPRTSLCTFRSG